MSMQADIQILRQCTGGAHERLVYVIPKHMARATGNLNMAWVMSQVVFWQQYNMENHGHVWVIKPAKEWQSEFGMSRREFEGTIDKLIADFGLQKKVVKSAFYNNNTTLCLRFDPHILWSKLQDELNRAFLNVQNEHSEMTKMNNPLFTEVRTENTNKKEFTPPNGDVVAPQKSIPSDTPKSSSHSKGTGDSDINPNVSLGDNELENVPPRADEPHAPSKRKPKQDSVNNRADAPKGGYQVVFGAVAKHVFEISDIDQAPPKLIGLVAGYLWGSNKSMQAPRPQTETDEERANNIVKDVQAFSVWYKRKYSDAVLPRDLAKFAGHWLAFWANRKNVYTPRKDEGIVWGAIVDEQNTEQDSNVHYFDGLGGKIKLMDLILSGQTNSEDEN